MSAAVSPELRRHTAEARKFLLNEWIKAHVGCGLSFVVEKVVHL